MTQAVWPLLERAGERVGGGGGGGDQHPAPENKRTFFPFRRQRARLFPASGSIDRVLKLGLLVLLALAARFPELAPFLALKERGGVGWRAPDRSARRPFLRFA